MLYCSKCGNQLADDAKFCSRCSAPVENQNQFNAYANPNQFNAYAAPSNTVAPSNKTSKIIGVCAAILAGASTFFPFFEINALFAKQSITLMSAKMATDGYVIMGIAIFVLLLNLAGKTKVFNILGGAAILAIVVIEFYFNQQSLSSTSIAGSSYDMSNLLAPGIGFYTLIIAGIALMVAGFMHKKV